MKINLLHPDNTVEDEDNLRHTFSEMISNLFKDLEMETIFKVMSNSDKFIYQTIKNIFARYTTDINTIKYRQNIIKDFIKNKSLLKKIYSVISESLEKEKNGYFFIFSKSPSSILYNSVGIIFAFLDGLKKLYTYSLALEKNSYSDGIKNFCKLIKLNLNENYLNQVEKVLIQLQFKNGILIKAKPGKGNIGTNYELIKPLKKAHSRGYSFSLSNRDDAGFQILGEIKNRSLINASNLLSQAAEDIKNFFIDLKKQLSFYMGVLNLYEKINNINLFYCFPEPYFYNNPILNNKKNRKENNLNSNNIIYTKNKILNALNLYDLSLAITKNQKIIDNDIKANHKDIIIITGANQGGKTTTLRSIGIAQLLMQVGMFVPAKKFQSNLHSKIFTHFIRKEDETMESGKLDEELFRMNKIVDSLTPKSLVLFNESFSSTNEREGSNIAFQIVKALIETDIKVIYVTHLYEFTTFFSNKKYNVLHLIAERKSNTERTFKLKEDYPCQTSFGEDIYYQIFKGF